MRKIGITILGACAVGGLFFASVQLRRNDLLGSSHCVQDFRIPPDRICMVSGWTSADHATLSLLPTHPSKVQDLIFLDVTNSATRRDSRGDLFWNMSGTPNLGPSQVSPNGRYVFEGSKSLTTSR